MTPEGYKALLAERERTGTISVRAFYLRRVCRIWPLYFAVVAFGLIFYNALLPKLGITYPVAYSIPTAVVLYSFFLPNLMNSLYTVGGILNPLWSIGIEEQYYLAWAPAVKRWHARLPWLLGGILAVSLVLFGLCASGFFGPGGQPNLLVNSSSISWPREGLRPGGCIGIEINCSASRCGSRARLLRISNGRRRCMSTAQPRCSRKSCRRAEFPPRR